jgi:all-trans-retinol 13,14-reductase
MHCFLHGVSPEEVSFAQHACIVGPYYLSVYGLGGGGRNLSKAFDNQMGRLDVRIYCGQEASEILLSQQRAVTGVRLANDEVLECAGCVSTLHPRSLLDLVPHSLFRRSFLSRLKTLEETTSAYMVYGAWGSRPRNLGPSNLILSPGPVYPLFRENGPLEERIFFISFPQKGGKKSSDQGVMVLCQAHPKEVECWFGSRPGKRPSDYLRFKEQITERMGRHLEMTCPEFAGQINYLECCTPLTLKEKTNSPYGSLYGAKHRLEQYNPLPSIWRVSLSLRQASWGR